MSTLVKLSDHSTTVDGALGDGSDVAILVHSALLDRRMWGGFTRSLSTLLGTGWTVASYDIRGHGTAQSAPAVTGVDQLAGDLLDLIAAIAPDRRVHILGLSLGGAVVQQAALDRSELLSSVTVVASNPRFPANAMQRRAQLGPGGVAAEVDSTIERWFGTTRPPAQDAAAVAYVRERLQHSSPQLWHQVWTALGGFDVLSRLPTLASPILAVAGSEDTAAPPANLELLAATVPAGRSITLPGAGHLAALTHPDDLARATAPFLASASRDTA